MSFCGSWSILIGFYASLWVFWGRSLSLCVHMCPYESMYVLIFPNGSMCVVIVPYAFLWVLLCPISPYSFL